MKNSHSSVLDNIRAEAKLKKEMEADGFVFWTNYEKDSVKVVDNNDGTKNLSMYSECRGREFTNGPFEEVRISEFAYTAYGTRALDLVGIYVKHPK